MPEPKPGQTVYCKVPYAINPKESKIYRAILHMHCQADDKDSPDHKCQGCVSISRGTLVARCKRCGDVKGVLHDDDGGRLDGV